MCGGNATSAAEMERAQAALVAQWQTRFEDLLAIIRP